MYAVVEVGGRQYRVSPGDQFLVEKLSAEKGSTLNLPVLLGRMTAAPPSAPQSWKTSKWRPKLWATRKAKS